MDICEGLQSGNGVCRKTWRVHCFPFEIMSFLSVVCTVTFVCASLKSKKCGVFHLNVFEAVVLSGQHCVLVA